MANVLIMRRLLAAAGLVSIVTGGCMLNEQQKPPSSAAPKPEQWKLDRTVLPILDPPRPTYSELDARKVKPPVHFNVTAPAGAPNVVIVLIDDLGFGATSTFWWPDQDTDARQACGGGPALQQLPHDRVEFPDAGGAQVGPEPSPGEHGFHHRNGDQPSGRDGTGSQFDCARRGDAAPQWVQHGGLRQVARNRSLGDERLGPV